MKELWSSIPDYPDHEISTKGRVRRVKRSCGRVLLDANKKPLYVYYKPSPLVNIGKKKITVSRIMAQVFLNEGDPLTRKQWAKVKKRKRNPELPWELDLDDVRISPVIPNTPPNGSRECVLHWCRENPIDDEKCQVFVLEKLGVLLSLKTIQAYRLSGGFKQR